MAVVRSAGALLSTGTEAAPGWDTGWAGAGSLQLYPSVLLADYAAIYRTQPSVRTVVSFLARNIAQLGIHVYRRVSDTDRQRLADHPLAALIERPNVATTRYRTMEALVTDLAVYDRAYLAKIRSQRGALQLVRVPPALMEPDGPISILGPTGFRALMPGGDVSLSADEVVYLRGYHPDDPAGGLSPLDTLRRILAEDVAASQYRENFWVNAARIEGVITRPLDAPPWTDEARKRFAEGWQALHSGAANSGRTAVLEDGMDFKALAFSAKDSQYIESRKLSREECAAAYHIPLPMVGILDHATFSNITEQHKQLYQDTLAPWLVCIAEELQLQLLPEFADTDRVYVEFNLAEKLKGSFEEQAQQLQSSVGAPWLTRNEARARMNLPALPEADGLVTPLNVTIGGLASPRDTAAPALLPGAASAPGRRFKAAPDDAAKAVIAERLLEFFARQRRSIASLAGLYAAASAADIDALFDAARWDRELAADLQAVSAPAAARAGADTLSELGLPPSALDADRMRGWLAANSSGVASGVNAATRGEIEAALAKDPARPAAEAVDEAFDGRVQGRAGEIAASHASAVAGFASEEAVRQQGLSARKTWVTPSPRPRATHRALHGQTVGLDELFGNGGRWPGDTRLPADERAGCTCHMTISVEV